MTSIPDAFHDLFEKRTFAHVATLTEETDPHVTPVWIDYDADDERLLVNTERGRRKERNVREDPSVGVSMVDPENPYRRLSIIGEVEEITTEAARDTSTNSPSGTRAKTSTEPPSRPSASSCGSGSTNSSTHGTRADRYPRCRGRRR